MATGEGLLYATTREGTGLSEHLNPAVVFVNFNHLHLWQSDVPPILTCSLGDSQRQTEVVSGFESEGKACVSPTAARIRKVEARESELRLSESELDRGRLKVELMQVGSAPLTVIAEPARERFATMAGSSALNVFGVFVRWVRKSEEFSSLRGLPRLLPSELSQHPCGP